VWRRQWRIGWEQERRRREQDHNKSRQGRAWGGGDGRWGWGYKRAKEKWVRGEVSGFGIWRTVENIEKDRRVRIACAERRRTHGAAGGRFTTKVLTSFCLHFVLFRSRDSMHASRNELYVVGSIETSGVQTATLTSFWWKIHIHFSNWNLIIFDANFLSFLCMKERALLPDYDLYT
jgi:hypothetical protein